MRRRLTPDTPSMTHGARIIANYYGDYCAYTHDQVPDSILGAWWHTHNHSIDMAQRVRANSHYSQCEFRPSSRYPRLFRRWRCPMAMPRDDNAFSGRDFDTVDTPGRYVNSAAAKDASATSTGLHSCTRRSARKSKAMQSSRRSLSRNAIDKR